ncbi:MAG: PF20097 family protein [Candidatus Bathyarchaeia archaeon]|nr:PF20097 family protein [Candidatus Bathyarchaeia archaeon]
MKAAEKTEEKAIEVCPLCGSKMEKGYVASKMISWSDKKSRICLSRDFSAEKESSAEAILIT